jgi:hypothetical protein
VQAFQTAYPLSPGWGHYSRIWPEHFWNCAEVTILGEPEPTISPAPTKAPTVPSPTNPPQPWPTNPPQMLPTNSPVTAPTGGNMGAGCCSQDFKMCVTWCTDSKDACDNCPNVLMTWLLDGPISSTCLARWETCTAKNQSGCCNGMICRGDQYYMRFSHPSRDYAFPDRN